MRLIYIPCKDMKEAKKIARTLLKQRLIACANFLPMHSMYWWKGKIKENNETLLLGKSLKKHFKAIQRIVKKLHSYEMPAILQIEADAEKTFDAYVHNEVH